MGKPTGFLEYSRETLPAQKPEQRVQHHAEFTEQYQESMLHRQSARCMNCGVPFCHSGCPLGNIIPEFNDAVYKGQWETAYSILSATNNFPEFTGRICPAPCEAACVLGINQAPVSIENIEKHIIEIAFEKGYVIAKPPVLRSGKRIAVVGSGPAGLAAADQLNQAGHLVTVFERDNEPGGLLRYGIPDFKLGKDIVRRRIGILAEEGIEFRLNAHVGLNVYISELTDNYDAIILAGGSTVPRPLPVPGSQASGVYFAMQFLKQQNKRNTGQECIGSGANTEYNFVAEEITATGKNVIVIGGGDTGSDCIGTSIRQNAKSILQLELLPQPPSQRTDDMPWPQYPMLMKTTSSHEEGGERLWSVLTKEFISDASGKLKAIKIADIEWTKGEVPGFKEVAGSEREIPCELALLAMGFLHPEPTLAEKLDLQSDSKRNIKASTTNYKTNRDKIYVCGDMRRGQSLVVWAIQEGRACAASVDAALQDALY